MEVVQDYLEHGKAWTNEKLQDCEAWEIVFATFAVTFLTTFVYGQLTHRIPLTKRLKLWFFRNLRKLPMIQGKISAEKHKVRDNLVKEFQDPVSDLIDITELPSKGWDGKKVIEQTKLYLGKGEFDWTKGTQSGTVYNGNPELTALMTEVYGMAAWTNPLHPDTFPGVRKMEAEVVRVACQLFNGDSESSCGTVTSGGTESIMLACKAYRDYARIVKGIADPVLLVPVTAHAAFDKAASLLDIGIKHVPVHPRTQKVDVKAMKKMINSRTCLLVGSAPQYAHGSIDDITEIAKLGKQYDIPVHVDACLGGFLICFMRNAGFSLPPFDFSVDGVTSISADTHKYGYAPKGSSVILYSDIEYRHYQWFTCVDWPGGLYATPVLGGSRSGGIIAACWASLMHYGMDGYVDSTRKVINTTRNIVKGLEKIQGIKIIGDPQVSVVAIDSDQFNIYSLSQEMKKRGWNLSALQFPPSIHLCVTLVHTQDGVADKFVNDIREIVAYVMADPEKYAGGSVAMYGMAQTLPDRGIVDQLTWIYLDALYSTGTKKTASVKNGSAKK